MNKRIKSLLKQIPGIRTVFYYCKMLNDKIERLQKENEILLDRIETLTNEQIKMVKRAEERRILVNERITEFSIKSKRYDYCADKLGELVPQIKQSDKRQKMDMEAVVRCLDSMNKMLNDVDIKLDSINEKLKHNEWHMQAATKAANESVWSSVFHDTIWNSSWLLNRKFSPGRWAVGYQYLYVLYRVLNEAKPKSILELGLGQSTQMITQYVEYIKDCEHIVTEHDENWIEFFKNNNVISSHSNIMKFDLCKKTVLDDTDVTAYSNFYESLHDKKFDLISIDAPFGAPVNVYARTDVLELLPQCLEERFIIMVDDYNRSGEQKMVELLKKKLEDSNIEFCVGKYSGNKDTLVITSMDVKFLTTL